LRSVIELPIAVRERRIVNHKRMPPPSVAEHALYFLGLTIARLVYRVTTTGGEQLPPRGFLLLPNHITWVDALVLQLACPRKIRFVIHDEFYRQPVLHPILRTAGAIPITARRAREAVRLAADRIRAGEIVCLFPEGQLSRSGTLLRLQRGYELMARQAEAPVVPVWLDQLWGSIFSFQRGRFFTKWPRRFPYRVRVAFGAPIAADSANIAAVREELLKLGEFCFSQRASLRQHVGRAALRGLKRHPFRTSVIDGLDNTTLSSGKLIGAAAALGRHLKRECAETRVGILLPPGKGGFVANLATVLAGKVAVNLNFTSGHEAIESAKEQSGITTIISARAVAKRLENFSWTPNVIHLDELLPQLKRQIIGWWLVALLLPSRLLADVLGLPKTGDRTEAVLLFTSGSSGKPKGVPLTHRNIISNASQCAVLLDLRKEDLLLASLPLFHSFGITVTLWYPLIESVRVVTYPSPLEAAKIAAVVERHCATIMLATPTFLRAYLRKAEPRQLRSLRLLITGAEKLPQDLARTFEQRFGKTVYEGYGLTETSPVVSVNLPDPVPKKAGESVQPSNRAGSTGKMAPGIAAELRDPESDRKLTLHDRGMLWLRGENVFEGYLNDPDRTAEVLRAGWFKTGDLGRFDEDGFLYIDGRLSRFSKIGGEMVPHETVEGKIAAALNLQIEVDRQLAIVGVPDEAKGESLVLLAAIDIDLATLRATLAENGMPNLWIPRTIRRVDAIPLLASGKLDLARCKEAAIG
jgi:acyl-[acyl-carrier-protein]-phospholipid O-acyltransferase/long-chain-fatty-acid--[acyl-carrier-protein] ligase